MPKKQYLLTRESAKPCVQIGFRTVKQAGKPDKRQKVKVPFVPGKISEVDADVSMEKAIDAGFIVEVNTGRGNRAAEKAAPAPKKAAPKEEPKVEKEPEDEPDEAASGEGYEELDDGRFQCLLCAEEGDEKILKTEGGMISHIEDKHR